MTLLLPTLALRAFLGVSPIGTERRMVSYVSVLELRPLLSPCCCASLASPLLQQSRVHMMAASFCAFLTALLPMFVSAGLSSPCARCRRAGWDSEVTARRSFCVSFVIFIFTHSTIHRPHYLVSIYYLAID